MNKKTKTLLKLLLIYVAKRMGEPSTWASIAAMLAGAHIIINPGLWQYIIDAGLAFSGILGILVTEGADKLEE